MTFEVGNSTGFDTKRHIDAIAMNLWPSRGLAIHGIEMKISRSDWQRELSNPAKAEEIHQHCDFWWLAAAHGVVKDINEIPPGWGFLEIAPVAATLLADDKPPRLKLKRQAARLERAQAVDRGFVAAILRARERYDSAEVTARAEKIADRRVEAAIERDRQHRTADKTDAEKLLALLHASISKFDIDWVRDSAICDAVAFVMKTGVAETYSNIARLTESCESLEISARLSAVAIREALATAGVSAAKELPVAPFRRRA